MGGAQPLAATMAAASSSASRSIRRASSGASRRATSTSGARSRRRARALRRARKTRGRALSVGLVGNARASSPSSCGAAIVPDLVTEQTSRARSAERLRAGRRRAGAGGADARRRDPQKYVERRARSMAEHVRAMLDLQEARRGGLRLRQQPARPGGARRRRRAFDIPGFVPAYIRPLFCEGKGPFRWVALSGDPEDIAVTDEAVLELFPDNPHLHRWIDAGARARAVPGPAGAHLLARLRRARTRRASRSTSWCAPARSRRRSSSGAITSTAARSRRRTARPRR